MRKLFTKILIFSLLVLMILLVGCSNNNFDSFAQCLTDNGVTMFGAYWCPHCENQKSMFGGSFKNVDYVECSLPKRAGQTQICIDEEIKSYPTWEFPDGTRKTGVVSFEELSSRSGCALPEE